MKTIGNGTHGGDLFKCIWGPSRHHDPLRGYVNFNHCGEGWRTATYMLLIVLWTLKAQRQGLLGSRPEGLRHGEPLKDRPRAAIDPQAVIQHMICPTE